MISKEKIFQEVEAQLTVNKFTITGRDDTRPWGGFFVIDEAQAILFANYFIPGEKPESLQISGKLSPKILIVAPGKRLSWQYHRRRAETWKCIQGKVQVETSETNDPEKSFVLVQGEIVKIKTKERHRLIGMEDWGIVAEIWQHTDANHASDENDIVRLWDDFGRS